MKRKYERYFSRGYFLASRRMVHAALANWRVLRLGSKYLYLDPLTEVDVAYLNSESASAAVAIIGMSVDLEVEPGQSLLNAARAVGAYSSGGEAGLLRYLAYLGGRFVAVLEAQEGSTMIIPDCHATYSCYVHQPSPSEFFASSHSNLLGAVFELGPDDEAQYIMRHPDYVEPGGKYYPACLTPYSRVSPLFPNCVIRWQPGTWYTHRRFYPFPDHSLLQQPEDAPAQFRKSFESHVRRIAWFRNVGISLTGGLDSRVALAALGTVSNLSNHFSFTYYRPSPTAAMAGDLFAGSWLAARLGLRHQAVHLEAVDYACDFHRMYQVSFGRGARHPALARAYFEQLPHDFISLISLGSETGTMFYRERDAVEVTPEVLAEKFTMSAINRDPVLIRSFERYIEYTEFRVDKFLGLDFYDLFYWEHRNAKWASLWYSEADLAHFTVVPFNQRKIVEAMLSLPSGARRSRAILVGYLESRLGPVQQEIDSLQKEKSWED